MRLIVTRPEEDARPLQARLATLGHDAVVLPLLTITPRPQLSIPILSWQALCFTSANGPRFSPRQKEWTNVKVLTVGPQSATAARQCGYTNVAAHGGDVDGLCHYIAGHLDQTAGPLLYLSGAETSGDLEGKLNARGFHVHREIVYDALPNAPRELAAEVSAADGVLLYSPRSAVLWLNALQQAGLTAKAATLTHFCLSANVAAQLPKSFVQSVASTPDQSAMLTMLDRLDEQE